MSIRFSGGERFQRGRGIGGLLRLAKGLFKPVIQTIGKVAKSNTGKAIGRALKKQAISTGTNLLADVVGGNNLNEGINREVENIRQNAALGIQQLANTRKRYESDYESEIETNNDIKSRKKKKKKNQLKNKKKQNKNQPPKTVNNKKGDKFVFV